MVTPRVVLSLGVSQLAVVAAAGLPVAFGVGLLAGFSTPAAGVFAFLYGACNGALTIARGTLPLVLFDPATYGATVGRLLLPGFLASAVAPMLYAIVTSHGGGPAALLLSLAAALVALAAAIALRRITLDRRTS